MSGGISLGGKVAWCSDGTLAWYLEGMRDEAARSGGPDAPIARHLQDACDGHFMGQILYLDEVLTDVENVMRIRQLFEPVARAIAQRVATDAYASAYQQAFAAEVRAMLERSCDEASTEAAHAVKRASTPADPVAGSDAAASAVPRTGTGIAIEAGTTARAVERALASRRSASIPIEGVLSLPMPLVCDGRLRIAFFWTSQGGPANARRLSAPYGRTIVNPSAPDGTTFERLDPGALGIPADAAPLSPRVGAGLARSEREALQADFAAWTDRLATRYVRDPDAPAIDADGTLAAYRRAFTALSVIALRPAYRALSPHFFDWVHASEVGGVPAGDDPIA